MKIQVSNAFSLQMCPLNTTIVTSVVTVEKAKELLREHEWVSAVGHQSFADFASKELGQEVPMNRVSTKLESGDLLLVGQVIAGRTPEGGFPPLNEKTVKWVLVAQGGNALDMIAKFA